MDDRNIRSVPLRDMKPPKINFRLVGLGILIFLAVLAVTSMSFTVQPEEVGVVQRFGKYSREASPGFNLNSTLDSIFLGAMMWY